MAVKCCQCNHLTPEGPLCMYCGASLLPPKKCPKCERSLPGTVDKCHFCGANFNTPEPVTCAKCGRKVAAHLTACVMCGTPLAKHSPAVPRPTLAAAAASAPPAPTTPPQASAAPAAFSPATALTEAQMLVKGGKLNEALARLEQAIAADENWAAAWNAKAQVLLLLARHADAVPCFERALKLVPDDAVALGGLGEALLRTHRFKEAEAALLRSLELQPERAKPLVFLAHTREMLGRKERALEDYARFLWKATPELREQIDFARQKHKKLLSTLSPPPPQLAPHNAKAQVDRAYELQRKGLLQDAVTAYDEALEADPNAIVAWLNMGACLAQLGRPQDALLSFDRGVKSLPGLPGAWVLRGTCLADLGRRDEALESFDKALELNPMESAAWGNKAALLNALNRPREALPCLERALLLDPYKVVAWYNRGCTEKILGQRDAAKSSLQRFLELAPEGVEDQVASAKKLLRELEAPADGAADEVVMKLPAKPLQVLGNRYEVYKELGRGGMGVVYLAVTRDQGEVCALKTFLSGSDPAAVEAFKREAKMWIELDRHPHLVAAYYVDEIGGRLYIAMEFIAPGPDGCNTLDAVLRTQPPGLNQTLRWAIQFCYGMEFAYTKGIRCHRDIKPANIMIDRQQTLKISDFGLAAAAKVSAQTAATGPLNLRNGQVGLSAPSQDGAGAGTPTHMPPEQWRSGAECDERSDIYAFGVTLYQMVAKGRLPLLAPLPQNHSPQESERFMLAMYNLHCNAAPPPLNSPLWPVIERCLRKDPSERYRSFQSLREDLEPLLTGLAQGETVPAPAAGELTAGELLNKGLSLEALNRFDDALRNFDDALRLEPGHAGVWEAKATTLARMGRLNDALQTFDQAIALNPKAPLPYVSKASALLNAKRPAEALACYDQSLAADPAYTIAWRNKARCLFDLNRTDEALACFDRALELEPESALGWRDKADILRLSGRHAEAAAGFEQSLTLDLSSGIAWNLLGETYIALQRMDEGLKALDRAVALDPGNYNASVNRGACLVRAGRPDEALAEYDRALTLDDKPVMAWNNKGDLHLRLKQLEKADECFDRALELEPAHVLAVQNKALRLRDAGKLHAGLTLLETGLRAHPDASALWYFKGEFLRQQQQYEPALAAYQQMLKVEKSNVRAIGMALCHSGECCEQLSRFNEALQAFGKAAELIPNYREALEGSARCRARITGSNG